MSLTASAMGLMSCQIEFTNERLVPERVLGQVQSADCGACLLFVGTTRRETRGRLTDYLVYECYEPMARRQLELLVTSAIQQWPIKSVAIAHRLGRVDLGEASIALAIASPHRDAAFASGAWLMDQIKISVPIWKQEHWSDGSIDWVHPGTDVQAAVSKTGQLAPQTDILNTDREPRAC